ncbi:hypothetical protein ABFT51_20810 [Paenibacillus peoriae]|uniref:hypothetical protein n=1 Tax=Paenibacillus peoriae TaxID=59893 RepID=UPI0032AF94F1
MDQKEYLKKMVELRKKKSELLAYSREPWANKYLKKSVKDYASRIPVKNSDLPEINSPKFETMMFLSESDYQILVARAKELKNEYKTSMAPIGSPKPVSELVPDSGTPTPSEPVKNDSEGKQMALELRGGRRSRAGRKSLGVKRTVTISMPELEWADIDDMVKRKEFKSQADYFRTAHRFFRGIDLSEGD